MCASLGKGKYKQSMFTDIYVTIQANHVLQERWHQEAAQPRVGWLAALLRRAPASK
jgi:hypothetical protein